VLLARARYKTVIFIPVGDTGDATRAAADFDAIAAFLRRCGAAELAAHEKTSTANALEPEPQQMLRESATA